jgi:hypothetical protein
MKENQLIEVLTREGVLINVSVKYWRATKKLKAEDLGLSPDNVEERLISLGHKKLLPKDSLQAFALIESRARSIVESATFPFLDGLGHFLPNAKLQFVTEKLAELHQEFDQATREFLAHYAQTRESATQEWKQAAQKLPGDPERLLATIEGSFPRLDQMEKSFGFAVQMFQIRVPEQLGLEIVSAIEQAEVLKAREQAARKAAEQIHSGVQSFVSSCVASLREQTSKLCEEMLESIKSGKNGVHQRTLNRLIKFIDEFKTLNFVGDRQMEEQLDRMRKEFLSHTAEHYRDDAYARERLEQGLSSLAQTAMNMAQEDSRGLVERFGQMGVRKFHLAA